MRPMPSSPSPLWTMRYACGTMSMPLCPSRQRSGTWLLFLLSDALLMNDMSHDTDFYLMALMAQSILVIEPRQEGN